mgnify:CR=1 FL=1
MTLSKITKSNMLYPYPAYCRRFDLLFGISITKSTVLSPKYMNYVFDKCNVSEQCEKAFKDQISVLEAQSGIPSRVFDAVYKNNDISNSAHLQGFTIRTTLTFIQTIKLRSLTLFARNILRATICNMTKRLFTTRR